MPQCQINRSRHIHRRLGTRACGVRAERSEGDAAEKSALEGEDVNATSGLRRSLGRGWGELLPKEMKRLIHSKAKRREIKLYF